MLCAMPVSVLLPFAAVSFPECRAGTQAQYGIVAAAQRETSPARQLMLTVMSPVTTGAATWQMEIELADGAWLAIQATSERLPLTSVSGTGRITQYAFRDRRGKVTRYLDARTGQALLPSIRFEDHFLPTCLAEVARLDGFAVSGQLLGHVLVLRAVEIVNPPTPWKPDLTLSLDPDRITGILWSIKDDGTGKNSQGDYRYVELTEEDYRQMLAAGCTYFGWPPEKDRSFLIDQPAFFRLKPVFPDDFYRANYYGWEPLVDEPAVHYLNQRPLGNDLLHPSQAADAFVTRLAAIYSLNDVPYKLHRAVVQEVSPGTLDLPTDNIPVWETWLETAYYQLLGGAPGIVHEGRYRLDDGDNWHPRALFGGPVDLPAEALLRFHYALLRGAARATGKPWGTSLYGQSDPALRERALTLAYDMGAKWFWLWNADHDHHLPHTEKLRLLEALSRHAEAHPNRDLDLLVRSATTAIVLPWGYVLGWYDLWGCLGLDEVNATGTSYRQVVAAAAWEGVLAALRGEDFDFVVEYSGLDRAGYTRIIRVGENGDVSIAPPLALSAPPRLSATLSWEPGTLAEAEVVPATTVFPCRPCHGKPPVIDGSLSDWEGPWIEFPGDRYQGHGDWHGPDDLSARVALAYDNAWLYLAAEVRDDTHCQPRTGKAIWDADSIQIALDPLNIRNAAGYAPTDVEIGFALGDDGQVATWRWHGLWGRIPGPLAKSRVAIVRDHNSRSTRYEAAIGLEEIVPLVPAMQRYAGFCLVINDADVEGPVPLSGIHRKSFFEASPGAVTAAKNPAAFASLEFLPPDPALVKADTTQRIWGYVVPERGTLACGAHVPCTVSVSTVQSDPPALVLAAQVETLPPLPRAGTQTSIRLLPVGQISRYRAALQLDVPPGRYHLTMTLATSQGEPLFRHVQTLFVHPPKQ